MSEDEKHEGSEENEAGDASAQDEPDREDDGQGLDEQPQEEAEPEEAAEEEAQEEAEPEQPPDEEAEEEAEGPKEEAEPEEGAAEEAAEEEVQEEAEPEQPSEGEAEEEVEGPKEEPEPEEGAAEEEVAPKPKGSSMGLIIAVAVLGIAIVAILAVLFRPSPKRAGEPSAPAEVHEGAPPAQKLSKAEQAKKRAEEAARKAKEIADNAQKLVAQLDTTDFQQRSTARSELVKLGSAAVEPLAAALNADSSDLRANVVKTLGDLKLKAAVRPLAKVMKVDQDVSVRIAAVQALSNIGDLAAVDSLIQALTDEDMDVQNAAIDALQAVTGEYKLMETEEDDPKVLQKMWTDWFAKNKAGILAKRAKPKVKKQLPMHLHVFRASDHAAVAYLHPIEGMPGGGLHGEEGSHKLLEHLKTLKADALMAAVKSDSAWLFKAIGGLDSGPKLIARLKNREDLLASYVRARLMNHTIAKMNASKAPAPKDLVSFVAAELKRQLDTDPALRGNACRQLGILKAKEALPFLVEVAKEDADVSVKLLAARAIVQIGDAQAVEQTAVDALTEILAAADVNASVRAAAAFVLGESGRKKAIPALIDALAASHEDMRRRAHEALAAITKNAAIKWDKDQKPQDLQKLWKDWHQANAGK